MKIWGLLFALFPLLAFGQACIVHSQGQGIDVTVCQANRSIPETLFRDGFCQPQLQGQRVDVEFVTQCPSGAHGVCERAHSGGGPYQQDIYYYGRPTDGVYLQAACTSQYRGTWLTLQPAAE